MRSNTRIVQLRRTIAVVTACTIIAVLLAAVPASTAAINLGAASYLPLVFAEPAQRPQLTAQPTPATSTPTSTLTPTPTAFNTPTPTATGGSTATPTTTPGTSVSGKLLLYPRYRELVSSADPVAYLVLLDVSGSMSFNYVGEGTLGGTVQLQGDTLGGTDYRCERSSPSPLPYNDFCTGGPDSAWRNYQERRIYQAKARLRQLVAGLNSEDVVKILAFSTGVSSAGYTLLPADGWTNDAALLDTSITLVGSYQGDPYRTVGASTQAQAMSKARDVLANAPTTSPQSGRPYRYVVITIADGPANVFINGVSNVARDICSEMSVNAARNTLHCQVGFAANYAMLRPVSAMIDQATNLKQEQPVATVFTISMVPWETGMSQVASSPQQAYSIETPNVVEQIVAQTGGVEHVCFIRDNGGYIGTIDGAHAPSFGSPHVLPPNVYGYVTLFDSTGTVEIARQPIVHNQVDHQLSYRFEHLAEGTYQVQAFVGYKGDDGISRRYDWLSFDKTHFSTTLSIQVEQSASNQVLIPPIYAELAPTVNVCQES